RRRLELLSAELAEIRPDPGDPLWPGARDGSGEPPGSLPEPGGGGGPGSGPEPGSVPGRHAHRPVGLGATLTGWAGDRVPATLQGRARMTVGHLVVVALVVAAGLGVTAWWVGRADGGSRIVAPVTSPAPGSSAPALATPVPTGPAAVPGATVPGATVPLTPGPTSGTPAGTSSSGAATGHIVVDVTGKVRRPGIATLALGSRVVDAVEAAGGARRGVRLGGLNLARVLTDGEQIVVGVRPPPGVAATAASAPTTDSGSTPMVDINTAGQTELEELPGVGPVTAQAILDFRTQNGTFTSVEELLEVSGIGDATLAKVAPYVTL
ncbi:MAG: helix-hairpin-helix domain-containing protein, partial [Nocardioidaceae bacterium]